MTTEELRELAVDDARHKAIIELAREEYQKDGETEIDDNAPLSEGGDNGCYVQAWVWVTFGGTPYDKNNNLIPNEDEDNIDDDPAPSATPKEC